jgi:hypothetical protein
MFATARYQWARWCKASFAPGRTAMPLEGLQAR